jgi:hypothetical protein
MEKDATLTFRLPKWLKEELTQLARADGRKLGGLVTKVLRDFAEGRHDIGAAGRGRDRPAAQRVAGDRVPRNKAANAARRDRKPRRTR